MDQAKTEERTLDKTGVCVILDLAYHSPTIPKHMLDCRHEYKQNLPASRASPYDSKVVDLLNTRLHELPPFERGYIFPIQFKCPSHRAPC